MLGLSSFKYKTLSCITTKKKHTSNYIFYTQRVGAIWCDLLSIPWVQCIIKREKERKEKEEEIPSSSLLPTTIYNLKACLCLLSSTGPVWWWCENKNRFLLRKKHQLLFLDKSRNKTHAQRNYASTQRNYATQQRNTWPHWMHVLPLPPHLLPLTLPRQHAQNTYNTYAH